MRGVPEEERCAGWRTGKCAATRVQMACPNCGEVFEAETEDGLVEVLRAHFTIKTECAPAAEK